MSSGRKAALVRFFLLILTGFICGSDESRKLIAVLALVEGLVATCPFLD
jgi:hypothetical protein